MRPSRSIQNPLEPEDGNGKGVVVAFGSGATCPPLALPPAYPAAAYPLRAGDSMVGEGLGNGLDSSPPLGEALGCGAAALGVGLGNGLVCAVACVGVKTPAQSAATSQRATKGECRERTQAVFAARLASRDFLRFALFLWMMPRTAALSNADTAARFTSAGALCSVAFL